MKVLYGDHSFQWRDIERVAMAVYMLEYHHGIGGYRNNICKRVLGWDSFAKMMHEQEEMRKNGSVCKFLNFMSQVGSDFCATDPRDMVFAFAGLLNEEGIIFRPDYSRTACQVYSDATRAIIDATESLNILALVRGYKSVDFPDLPSWSPCWNQTMAVPMPVYSLHSPQAIHASGSFKHRDINIDSTLDNVYFLVRGRVIDSVGWVRYFHRFESHYFMDDLHKFLDIGGVIGEPSAIAKSPVSRERILRATIADCHCEYIRSNVDETGYLSEAYISKLLTVYDDYPQLKTVYDASNDKKAANLDLYNLQQAGLVTQRQRLFLSVGNKVGLAPVGTRHGDQIYILHGAKAPVVLRSNEDGTWMPIGMCYLEKCMLGEAMTWAEEDANTFILS